MWVLGKPNLNTQQVCASCVRGLVAVLVNIRPQPEPLTRSARLNNEHDTSLKGVWHQEEGERVELCRLNGGRCVRARLAWSYSRPTTLTRERVAAVDNRSQVSGCHITVSTLASQLLLCDSPENRWDLRSPQPDMLSLFTSDDAHLCYSETRFERRLIWLTYPKITATKSNTDATRHNSGVIFIPLLPGQTSSPCSEKRLILSDNSLRSCPEWRFTRGALVPR